MSSKSDVDQEKCRSFEQCKSELKVSDGNAKRISNEFERQVDAGFQDNGDKTWMIPSMVEQMPTGHETGAYYGIHISGEDIDMVYTILSDAQHTVDLVQQHSSPITGRLMRCTSEELFGHVADVFLEFSRSISRDLTMAGDTVCGLALSFPCIHESLSQGTLVKWTKGFAVDGMIGNSPIQMLNNAFAAKGIRVTVVALCNNTVATICATRYVTGLRAEIAIAMNTGCNASYVEDLSRSSNHSSQSNQSSMVINTEWPAFRSQNYRMLAEDVQLDESSQQPGDQPFEKLTGPMYLGEVARLVLISIIDADQWQNKFYGRMCSMPGSLTLDRLILMAEDSSGDLLQIAEGMHDVLQIYGLNLKMCKQVQDICVLVLQRSAKLVAATTVGILQHQRNASPTFQKDSESAIGISGRLFEGSRLFRSSFRTAMKLYSESDCDVQIYGVTNGAPFGAALVAAASLVTSIKL